jgi:hypothetical protein
MIPIGSLVDPSIPTLVDLVEVAFYSSDLALIWKKSGHLCESGKAGECILPFVVVERASITRSLPRRVNFIPDYRTAETIHLM